MYHIPAAHGQTDFIGAKAFDRLDFQPTGMGGGEQFALAVRGTVAGLDNERRRLVGL
jgi:hypothetical protein